MCEWTGISIPHQRLAFAGSYLEDDKRLVDYNLYEDCTITVLRVRKGPDKSGSNGVSRVRGWPAMMNDLEIDHFGFLFEQVVNSFRKDEAPHQEVYPLLNGD